MAQEQYAAIATASTSHLVIGTSDDTAVADYLGGDFDTEYLDVADTPGIKHRLTRAGIDTDDLVVISVVGAATADDVESGIFGHSGGALPKSLCAMTDVDRDAMVAEAAASGLERSTSCGRTEHSAGHCDSVDGLRTIAC